MYSSSFDKNGTNGDRVGYQLKKCVKKRQGIQLFYFTFLTGLIHRTVRLYLFTIAFLAFLVCTGQDRKVDSIQNIIKNTRLDTVRFNGFFAIGDHFQFTAPDSAVYFHTKALEIASELKDEVKLIRCWNELLWDHYSKSDYIKAEEAFKEAIKIIEVALIKTNDKVVLNKIKRLQSSCITNMASVLKDKGDYTLALEYYTKALQISNETGNRDSKGAALANIATVHHSLGNYVKSLEFNFLALKIFEEAGNKAYAGAILGNIGMIYSNQGDYNKALLYLFKSLKLCEENDSKQGTGQNLENIGIQYSYLLDHQKARDYFLKALSFYEEIGNVYGMGSCYGNLSMVHRIIGEKLSKPENLKNFEIALNYSKRAVEINRKIENKQGLSFNLANMGYLNVLLHQYDLAEQNIKAAFDLASSTRSYNEIKEAHYNYYFLYEKSDRPVLALKHYKLFVQYRDSVFNKDKIKASLQQEIKFNYEKKATADSVKSAEHRKVSEAKLVASEARLKQEKTQRLALYGGLFLVAVFAAFMVNRFRITNRQKILIERQKKATELQKNLVEEKQKEILDSIRYAKRIQTALLTSERYIERNLNKFNKK